MATTRRSANPSVVARLRSIPHRFVFFQAVRLLERIGEVAKPPLQPVGYDSSPNSEAIRFVGAPHRSFPANEVESIVWGEPKESSGNTGLPVKPTMSVGFMGLYGPMGVLPNHDTQRIIDLRRQQGAEKELLDLFQHRIISLFYRAWAKYRLPIAYERTYRSNQNDQLDPFAAMFYSLVGLGTAGLRNRQCYEDETNVLFGGLFAHKPKCGSSLGRMIGAIFGTEAKIEQFVGQWLSLAVENRSQMPSLRNPLGQHCRLGQDFILGDSIWDVQGKFRLRLGPMNYQKFQQFLPGGESYRKCAELVRLYAGPQFDFEIQLELLAEEIPAASLSGNSRLGQNTWLMSQPITNNRDDALFSPDGWPLN